MEELDYKKYMTNEITWEFKIDNIDFSCEEICLGEEVDFFNYYIEGDGRQNVAKLRLVQCTKLVKTPFTSKWIKELFDKFYPKLELKDKIDWKDLNLKYRLLFLEKLDKNFMSDIMNEVAEHYNKKEDVVKN